MKKRVFAVTTTLAALLMVAAIGHAQAPTQTKPAQSKSPQTKSPSGSSPSATATGETLKVAGYAGQAPILQINGKSCVELEQLARLTQASLTFKGHQIVLSLSAPSAHEPAEETKAKQGFSRSFLQAGIEQMGVIREWRSGIANAIQSGFPLPEDWFSAQRRNADKSLALVSAAMSTDDDHKAFPLLSAELNNVQRLSENYLATRKNAEYIAPGSLDNDPLNQQILSCLRAFAAMTADNKFQDEAACH
ncbi:MAG: hypothetical protein ABSD64_11580 [Terriglobales bacterium]|jgi:hypothetical protein